MIVGILNVCLEETFAGAEYGRQIGEFIHPKREWRHAVVRSAIVYDEAKLPSRRCDKG